MENNLSPEAIASSTNRKTIEDWLCCHKEDRLAFSALRNYISILFKDFKDYYPIEKLQSFPKYNELDTELIVDSRNPKYRALIKWFMSNYLGKGGFPDYEECDAAILLYNAMKTIKPERDGADVLNSFEQTGMMILRGPFPQWKRQGRPSCQPAIDDIQRRPIETLSAICNSDTNLHLELLAYLTHTVGNFMRMPVGENLFKGRDKGERADKYLSDLLLNPTPRQKSWLDTYPSITAFVNANSLQPYIAGKQSMEIAMMSDNASERILQMIARIIARGNLIRFTLNQTTKYWPLWFNDGANQS